jgi:hypothetical protein
MDELGKPTNIRITAIENSSLELINLASWLYDIILLHDRLLLMRANPEQAILYSHFYYGRSSRKIHKEDRIRVDIIRKASPLIVEIAIPVTVVATAFFTIVHSLKIGVEAAGMIADWNQDRAIKRLQRENMELENEKLRAENISPEVKQAGLQIGITQNKALEMIGKDAKRLSSNAQLAIIDVEIIIKE